MALFALLNLLLGVLQHLRSSLHIGDAIVHERRRGRSRERKGTRLLQFRLHLRFVGTGIEATKIIEEYIARMSLLRGIG